jgi:hypothetical protein
MNNTAEEDISRLVLPICGSYNETSDSSVHAATNVWTINELERKQKEAIMA